MKKLMNAVENILTESLRGFGRAHDDIVSVSLDPMFVTRKAGAKPGKVALISGGGSGHEPMHAGFVGLGMLDAACPGQVFTSPTPDQMLAAAEAVDTGAGALFIVKNYEGDVMNFEMAAEMCGRETLSVVTDDDVAVESSTFSSGRRGVAAPSGFGNTAVTIAEALAPFTVRVLGCTAHLDDATAHDTRTVSGI